jgi:hypothetical protein
MSARRFQFTVDHMVGRREIELRVTYSMTAPVAATYWQPAEGAEVEIVSIKHDGQPFEVSEAEEDALLEQAKDRAHDDWEEDIAAEAEWRADQRRDKLLMDRWDREQSS